MSDAVPQRSYLGDGHTLRSWLLTTDHKRIAILYIVAITFFFFAGGFAAFLIRYNLISPKGLIGSAETYNRLFSMHGILMVWFFLVPAVPVTLLPTVTVRLSVTTAAALMPVVPETVLSG